jgi:hypothetical protein
MNHWIEFLESNHIDIEDISEDLIQEFVNQLNEQKKSPKGFLYVLMNYFKFTGDKNLLKFTATLRESFTKKTRKVFQIKDFEGMNQEYISKLNELGIRDVNDMIKEAETLVLRKKLSDKTGIPKEEILRLAQLSDITRIGYVKSILAPLYHAAGIISPEVLAKYSAEELHQHFREFIDRNNYPAEVPFLKDLEHNINNARKIQSKIEP